MGPVHGSFLGQSSFRDARARERAQRGPRAADLPLERLGPLGCGVLTGAGAVLNVLRPAPGSELAVFGLGTVGLSGVMAGAVAGCERIIGIDPDAGRRGAGARARSDAGAGAVVRPRAGAAGRGVARDGRQRGGGRRGAVGPDLAGGRAHPSGSAARATRSRSIRGTSSSGGRSPVSSRATPTRRPSSRGLLELHRDGRFPFDRLITEFPFERLPDALAAARGGDVVKPVLRFA
jgi:aryl-alcohol dehydrogenase